jgi:hypothetical protein
LNSRFAGRTAVLRVEQLESFELRFAILCDGLVCNQDNFSE